MSDPIDAPAAGPSAGLRPLPLLAALGTGGLLSLMVLCNAEVGRHGGPLAASLAPHATGLVAAAVALALLRRRAPGPTVTAPGWAYLGGLAGAVTVMLTSSAAVTPLGLSGTLALGLLGQVAFGLAADRWGLLGLPRRRATARDGVSLALILAGSAILILGRTGVTLVPAILMAALAGLLVGLSRQVNGRLALARGALGASFWNHAVGFAALLALALAWRIVSGEVPVTAAVAGAPLWAWAGGPIGVLFVAAGSWLIARIGAANTALLVIAGQMVSGALLDALRGGEGLGIRAVGVAVILAGVLVARGRGR